MRALFFRKYTTHEHANKRTFTHICPGSNYRGLWQTPRIFIVTTLDWPGSAPPRIGPEGVYCIVSDENLSLPLQSITCQDTSHTDSCRYFLVLTFLVHNIQHDWVITGVYLMHTSALVFVQVWSSHRSPTKDGNLHESWIYSEIFCFSYISISYTSESFLPAGLS